MLDGAYMHPAIRLAEDQWTQGSGTRHSSTGNVVSKWWGEDCRRERVDRRGVMNIVAPIYMLSFL